MSALLAVCNGNRWIVRTNGQSDWKFIPFMISPWHRMIVTNYRIMTSRELSCYLVIWRFAQRFASRPMSEGFWGPDAFGGPVYLFWWCGVRGIHRSIITEFLAATKQLYKWYFPSVCLSVRPSVCHTIFTMFPSSYHHEIFRSYYHGQKWCPCKRSRSDVKGQGHRGQHPT